MRYFIYIKVNIAEGVDRKQLLSHYEFRKEIALNWLDLSYEPRTHQIKDAPSNKKRTGVMSLFSSPFSVSTITTTSSLRGTFCNDSSLAENGALNRIPVMAPILAPAFGVTFLKGRFSLKNGTYCPLFSHDTTCDFLLS
jgi:hypothetical protein